MDQVVTMSAQRPQVRHPAMIQRVVETSRKLSPPLRDRSDRRSLRQRMRSDAASTTLLSSSTFDRICSGAPLDGSICRNDSARLGRRLVNEGKCGGDIAAESRASAPAIRCCNWAGDDDRGGASPVNGSLIRGMDAAAGCAGHILYTSIKTDIQRPLYGWNVGFYDPRCQASFAARNCCTIARAGISAVATAARILGSGDGLAVAASISSIRSTTNNLRRQRCSERNQADKSQVIRTPSGVGSGGADESFSVMGVEYSTSTEPRYAAKVANENGHTGGCPIFAPGGKIAPELGTYTHIVALCRAFEAREGASHTPNWPGRFPRAARSLWLCRPSNVRHPVHGRHYGAARARTRIATQATVQPPRSALATFKNEVLA